MSSHPGMRKHSSVSPSSMQVGRKTRYEQELSSLRDQLDKLRKEGMELQARLVWFVVIQSG